MSPTQSEVAGAAELFSISQSIGDWKAEFSGKVQGILSDEEFCTELNILWKMREDVAVTLGDMLYYRLRSQFGNMESDLEEKHNKQARNTFRYWVELITGSKEQDTYQRVYKMWRAAYTRALVPETADRSLTAQAEMGMNAGDTDGERRETIERRNKQMDSLDASGERDTTTAREVKRGEQGITDKDLWQPSLRLGVDMENGADYLITAQFGRKVVEETGEYSVEFDWLPLLRLDFAQPKSEELREQHTSYTKMILNRIQH